MPLSEHEQKMLDEMERQLFADDPRLAKAFAPKAPPRRNGRRIIIGLGAVVVGLGVLVLAVSLPAVWLGVIAFIGMLAGAVYAGIEITPYFDSLLVKLTTRAPDLRTAANRTRRALREFRVRGVSTNIDFVINLLKHPTFLGNAYTTKFIDTTPELFQQVKRQSHWSAGVLALVHSVGNGELQFPVFCKQDDQVNAVLAVVDTDVGQLGPHLFHGGQVHAEP